MTEETKETETKETETKETEEKKTSSVDEVLKEFIETGAGDDNDEETEEKDITKKESEKKEEDIEEKKDEPKDLYPKDKITDEDKKKLDFKMDDVTDSQIADAAYTADTFDELVKVSKEENKTMDDRFIALIARNALDPNFFAENKIFSIEDFVSKFSDIKKQTDPKAVLYPIDGTPEQVAEFQEKYDNIPMKPEGYGDEVFKDTYFDTDNEAKHELKQLFNDSRLSRDQARFWADRLHQERAHVKEEMQKDFLEYAKKEYQEITDTFGGDVEKQMRDIGKLIWKHGSDFAEEFKNTKVMKSASFFRFVSSILDAGSSAGKFTMNDFRKIVESGTSEERGLQWHKNMLEQILTHKDYQNDAKNSEDKKRRARYKRLQRAHETIRRAATARGFDLD